MNLNFQTADLKLLQRANTRLHFSRSFLATDWENETPLTPGIWAFVMGTLRNRCVVQFHSFEEIRAVTMSLTVRVNS